MAASLLLPALKKKWAKNKGGKNLATLHGVYEKA